ncbi:MAG TPA: LuxR C-terminal-related transcriptional regulator [Mycobacteriales bacterium]|nr:LuxR C-terminal-related transcriptional regulator [Mycobacteriales bacterium]
MHLDLDRARESFSRGEWGDAYDGLSALAAEGPLTTDDLHRLGSAAYLVGREDEAYAVWADGHRECRRAGDVRGAARFSFWLADRLAFRGDAAKASGWLDRGRRLLDGVGLDCVEGGYLDHAAAMRHILRDGDVTAAHDAFVRAAATGDRFGDGQLATLARIGEGRCLIYLGQVETGLSLLDEAMVAVLAHDVSAVAVGDAYCTVLDACHELLDVRRMAEWSAAFTDWCAGQPALVLYRGHCLLHQAELLHLRGEWDTAAAAAEQACAQLADHSPHPGALGAAHYLRGDVLRLRGELAEADEEFRRAHELGHEPQPGRSLLRLAEGRLDAAVAGIRRVLAQAGHPVEKAQVLGAYVEIVLAAGDVAAGEAAAGDLAAVAAELGSTYLAAAADDATGAVLLAQGDPAGALPALRRAGRVWTELGVRYYGARTQMLIAAACRVLGDEDGALLELDAATATLRQLGADRVAADQPGGDPPLAARADGLTAREGEVLTLVATGMSNRAIAERLVISEKTVATHVGHIFAKLGLSSRAAATAYAYQHGLQ